MLVMTFLIITSSVVGGQTCAADVGAPQRPHDEEPHDELVPGQPGLPDGDYFVWVNDTAHVLGELAQTGDPDGGLDNLAAAVQREGLLNCRDIIGHTEGAFDHVPADDVSQLRHPL